MKQNLRYFVVAAALVGLAAPLVAQAQTLPSSRTCLVDVSKTVCRLQAFNGDCKIEVSQPEGFDHVG